MGTILTPILTATAGTSRAYNPGIAETFSWLPIEGDALGRPLYARASYVTNFSDMSIFLSASELSIGAVTIKDNNSGLNADVVNIPDYGAGLQVLTQDLQSDIDDITIGDKQGHYADVNQTLSALNVYPVVPAGGYTLCQTRSSGNPTFTSKQILIHNDSNNDVNVQLTLTSGMSCLIPIGKNTSANHIMTLNLAVSGVNNYAGTTITFFA